MRAGGNTTLKEVESGSKSTGLTPSDLEEKTDVHHILIVDDEVEFVSSVKRHLKREGFTPDSAFTGEGACQKMVALNEKGRVFDLVITDVLMPGMDGISLMAWIHDMFPKTSVIVISEFMDLVHLENKIRSELDGIGRKPMTPGAMMRLISGISKKRGAIRLKEAKEVVWNYSR